MQVMLPSPSPFLSGWHTLPASSVTHTAAVYPNREPRGQWPPPEVLSDCRGSLCTPTLAHTISCLRVNEQLRLRPTLPRSAAAEARRRG